MNFSCISRETSYHNLIYHFRSFKVSYEVYRRRVCVSVIELVSVEGEEFCICNYFLILLRTRRSV